MEFVLLSQTCKTLYDKDYLDNMKNLEETINPDNSIKM